MKTVQSLIMRVSEQRREALREKLSDYVVALLEKNAARLAKSEKSRKDPDMRAELSIEK